MIIIKVLILVGLYLTAIDIRQEGLVDIAKVSDMHCLADAQSPLLIDHWDKPSMILSDTIELFTMNCLADAKRPMLMTTSTVKYKYIDF